MEAVNCERLFVVTGGPGSGKTTLVDALAEHGFCTMPVAGRAIIQDQVAITIFRFSNEDTEEA